MEALLASEELGEQVARDGEEAAALGVTGVPFFVFARALAVSGAQPVEVFTKALAAAEEAVRARPPTT